jgi:hypothetical protein
MLSTKLTAPKSCSNLNHSKREREQNVTKLQETTHLYVDNEKNQIDKKEDYLKFYLL